MDCKEAREHILEALAQPRTGIDAADVVRHLAGCETCRRFSETQLQLDWQLSTAISAPPLTPRFRKSLMETVHREPYSIWQEFLPDKAHLAGCICATAVSIPVMPFSTSSILLAGLAFTLVTYFFQSVIRGSLEIWVEGQL